MPVVQVYHDLARAEYFAFAVDVKPVFDHALKDRVDPIFVRVTCCVLEDAWEVVIPRFYHVVHVIVELKLFFGLYFVFVVVKVLVLFCI